MKDAFWDNKLVFSDEERYGLKRCPCCGGAPILKDDGYMEPGIDENGVCVGVEVEEPSLFWVECKDCGLQTSEYDTQEKAIEKWNKRVDHEMEV